MGGPRASGLANHHTVCPSPVIGSEAAEPLRVLQSERRQDLRGKLGRPADCDPEVRPGGLAEGRGGCRPGSAVGEAPGGGGGKTANPEVRLGGPLRGLSAQRCGGRSTSVLPVRPLPGGGANREKRVLEGAPSLRVQTGVSPGGA